MTKPIPTIQKFMTTTPHAVGVDQPLRLADSMMKKHGIRHLPVLDGGALVGVLSDRDLRLIEILRDVDPAKISVEEAMSSEAYAVSPEAGLDDVAETMATHKYGCAVVMQNNHVVGIFTTTDACRALADLLHTRLAK
jgi:acetoin utilization protein AcuB